jgi:SAM-dependent methyltransferase
MNQEIATEPSVFCPVCGKQGQPLYSQVPDRLFGVAGLWNYSACPDCKISWLNPKPKTEEIEKLYKTYYTHHQPMLYTPGMDLPLRKHIKFYILNKKFGFNISLPKKSLPRSFIVAFLGSMPSLINRAGDSIGWVRLKRDGKILDVGFGSGDFLTEMQYAGWQAYGLEPDGKVVAAAQALGLKAAQGILETAPYPENYFDAIYMDNVVEHLPNPEAALKKCFEMLVPGGSLVIKTCSNSSLAHRVFKKSYRGLETPRHFVIFSPLAIKKLGKKIAFKTTILKTSLNAYIWFSSYKIAKSKPNASEAPGNGFIRMILKAFSMIQLTIKPLSGDDILAVLKK